MMCLIVSSGCFKDIDIIPAKYKTLLSARVGGEGARWRRRKCGRYEGETEGRGGGMRGRGERGAENILKIKTVVALRASRIT